ncbi:hypothetical protein C8Q73DRAFT_14037 [Cubamyces lactineus]|nr:hypothetical protein C8Q73DRAFT_14037 [Cubamyces lactineus]
MTGLPRYLVSHPHAKHTQTPTLAAHHQSLLAQRCAQRLHDLPCADSTARTSDVAVVHHVRVSATLPPAREAQHPAGQARRRPSAVAVAVVGGVAVRFSQRAWRDRLATRRISHRPSPRNVCVGGVPLPGLAASRKRFSQSQSTQMRLFPSSSGLARSAACPSLLFHRRNRHRSSRFAVVISVSDPGSNVLVLSSSHFQVAFFAPLPPIRIVAISAVLAKLVVLHEAPSPPRSPIAQTSTRPYPTLRARFPASGPQRREDAWRTRTPSELCVGDACRQGVRTTKGRGSGALSRESRIVAAGRRLSPR